MFNVRWSAPIALLVVAGACSPHITTGRGDDSATGDINAHALAVIEGERLEMSAAGGATITSILRRHVPNLTISQHNNSGSCPTLTLRGQRSTTLSSEPSYYVDGTRLQDGCFLETLSPRDVESIEVYGAGQSPANSNIPGTSGGLILIMTKR